MTTVTLWAGKMEFTVGCSIAELRSNAAFGRLPLLNIEDPLYPGYLADNHPCDIDYLRDSYCGRLVLDGPYIDLNLGSPEPEIRSLARHRTLAAMNYARDCGAEALIVQSSYLPFVGAEFYDRGWIGQSVESWKAVLQHDLPGHIALCNTFEFYPDTLTVLVDALDDPRIEVAFDVGHCLLWGRTEPLEWYRKIRSRCRFLYLHSNDRTGDHHQSIRGGRFQELHLLQKLKDELRSDTVLILKYFDKRMIMDDLHYLVDFFR